ncbi:LUD domain-containing protein [Neomegalonema sp.]|uniref:LutC/YkgG family protein n=1 Tax=Neomegalonema sp. TaxID=2039713 RepID=UPI002638C25A|nr:LUD domain-containing protein [Neomegalonema sp.]MDD2870270.1 LUD domain-containing protein [Neomegalonema sp.]
MSARADILSAVRRALKAPPAAPDLIVAEAAALLEDLDPARPPAPADPVEAFFAKIDDPAFAASIERIDGIRALPAALRSYMARHRLGFRLCLQPQEELRALSWAGFDLHHEAAPDEAVALAAGRRGISETGSVVLESGPDSRILNLFLPFHLVLAVRASTILGRLEDHAEASAGLPPRNAILMTGASGTSDIEGSYVRGAHGPRFLHVILIEDRPQGRLEEVRP